MGGDFKWHYPVHFAKNRLLEDKIQFHRDLLGQYEIRT
jgi:hypothetical protein